MTINRWARDDASWQGDQAISIKSSKWWCACNHQTKIHLSLLSLDLVLCCMSLCCSDVPVCTPVNCSSSSQVWTQRGSALTHLANVLSVIPRPRVISLDVFSCRIRNFSMVWSEEFPPQNESTWRMVNYHFSATCVYSFPGMVCSRASICCKYNLADLT